MFLQRNSVNNPGGNKIPRAHNHDGGKFHNAVLCRVNRIVFPLRNRRAKKTGLIKKIRKEIPKKEYG